MNELNLDLKKIAEALSPSSTPYAQIFFNPEAIRTSEDGMKLAHALAQEVENEPDPLRKALLENQMLKSLCEVYLCELRQGTQLMGWIIGSLLKQVGSAGLNPKLPEEFLLWLERYQRR